MTRIAALVLLAMLLGGCQQLLENIASGVRIDSEERPGVVINCIGTGSRDNCLLVGDFLLVTQDPPDETRRVDLYFDERPCRFAVVGATNDDMLMSGTMQCLDE